jgi:hypothetical protein
MTNGKNIFRHLFLYAKTTHLPITDYPIFTPPKSYVKPETINEWVNTKKQEFLATLNSNPDYALVSRGALFYIELDPESQSGSHLPEGMYQAPVCDPSNVGQMIEASNKVLDTCIKMLTNIQSRTEQGDFIAVHYDEDNNGETLLELIRKRVIETQAITKGVLAGFSMDVLSSVMWSTSRRTLKSSAAEHTSYQDLFLQMTAAHTNAGLLHPSVYAQAVGAMTPPKVAKSPKTAALVAQVKS